MNFSIKNIRYWEICVLITQVFVALNNLLIASNINTKAVVEDSKAMYKAKEYVNASSLQFTYSKEIIDEFSKEISKMKGKCIDIGCGPASGTSELILPKLPPDTVLVGADISKSMIDYAKKAYANIPRLSFIELDIENPNLPLKEIGEYDNVFSFYCLHWCKDIRPNIIRRVVDTFLTLQVESQQAFENIYKLLHPNGTALIMFGAHLKIFCIFNKILEIPRYHPYVKDTRKYTVGSEYSGDHRTRIKMLLQNVGFDVLHCSNRPTHYIHQDMHELESWTDPIIPLLPHTPNHIQEEIKNFIMKELSRDRILLPCRDENHEKDNKILDLYHMIVAYIKKP